MAEDLADLDAFAAVARQRSFRGAASIRGVSASALSEAVRRLEGRLGVRLLNRTTRSVTPTEAGQRLLERLTPALGEVTAALEEAAGAGRGPTGSLRLNVPTVVAALVLPAMVGPFLKAYPGVRLEVTSDDSFIDVLAAGFDAGVRYGERLEQDMIAVPIGPRTQRFAAAASPAYLAAHGRPSHPGELVNHACIRHRFAGGRTVGWEFERGAETVRVTPKGPLIAGNMELEMAAAVAGVGVMCSFEAWLQPAFDRGDLEPILQDWWPSFSGPFLYYPSRTHMPAPLRAFVDFVRGRKD